MSFLPRVSGREAVKAFEKSGWHVARQKGSHIILTKEGSFVTLSVPDHRELDRGTLRKLISLAKMTVEEFKELLRH